MIFERYLDDTYLKLLYDNYEDYYLKSIDEDVFEKIYGLLLEKGITCINDLIIYYIEAFNIDYECMKKALDNLDDNFNERLNKDLTIFESVIREALQYSEE